MNYTVDCKHVYASGIRIPQYLRFKILIRMKLIALSLLLFLMQATAEVRSQTLNLHFTNAPLEKVLTEIKKQSGYSYIANAKLLKEAKKVTVNVSNTTLGEALTSILSGQNLSAEISDGVIHLEAKENDFKKTGLTQRVTRGRVTNEKGEPLVGASVCVLDERGRRTALQMMTDHNGGFAFTGLTEGTKLEIAYLGYTSQHVSVQRKMKVVVLKPIAVQVEEVVVTGLFKRPEGNFTGAVTKMKGEELKKVSSNNLFAAVAAMDPSFRIIPNNVTGGNINALPEVQLRGSNSMPNLSGELSANPNAPLFILDGFEVNLQRVVNLDMNMIESVTLLKDASATSIYGSRGANGVMVITTITPASGKVQVTVNNDFRITTPDLSVYNLLNAEEKLDFEKRTGVYTWYDEETYNNRLIAVRSGVNTDWLAIPVQTGTSNLTTVYLQGGDEVIRYGVQASADFQSGVMKGQDRKNYSGQFDLSYRIKNLRFQNSVRIFQTVANESPYGSFSQYARLNPYWSPYDRNGRLVQELERIESPFGFDTYMNPLYDALLHSVNKNQNFGFSNNFQMRYDMTPNLSMEANISLNKTNSSGDLFYPAQHSRFNSVADLSRKGSYSVSNNNDFGYEGRFMANYNKSFGKHVLLSTLGMEIASKASNNYTVNAEGFAFDKLDNLLFATQYEQNGRPTGEESTVNRIGILFNGNYTYDNRYFADISIRRDGSSQFGADSRFGTFWSTGAGWNIHNEAFFDSSDVVNRFRLRASYGSAGGINLPAYQSKTRYSFGTNNVYNYELGAAIMALGNDNLSWQDVRTANFGADVVLLNEALDLRLDHYRTITKNAISPVTLATSTGFSSYAENVGKIQNTGYELSVRYRVINNSSEGIIWSINASAAHNRNELKQLSNKLKALNEKSNASASGTGPNTLLIEGNSMNTIYVVKSVGVDPITGNEVYLDRNGEKTMTWNVNDKVAFGTTDPKVNGTFGTQLNYKGFNVSLTFDYRFGAQVYNSTLVDKVEAVDPFYNADRRAYDLGWTKPGDVSPYTRIYFGKSDLARREVSSKFVQDENTVNLTSASFSYNFYKHVFIKKLGFNSLQVTAITNDLVRISSIQIERGTSNPFARTYSLSLRANF